MYSLKELREAGAPYAISPIPGPKVVGHKTWIAKLFGIRVVPDLGVLTTSISATANVPIVQRSWGQLGGNSFYGPNFQVQEYSKARNYLTAFGVHVALILGAVCLTVPIFRNFARRFVYQPGDGPTKEASQKDRVDYRGIAKPDIQTPNLPRASCRAHFNGSIYACKSLPSQVDCLSNSRAVTGILAAEAAISILRDEHRLSGGIYTPASLGQKFIDRLQAAGFKFEKNFYEN